MPEVSIIIVSFNNLEVLSKCIDSIVENTIDVDYEIILVDNNTTSGSIEEFTVRYNRLKLIRNKKNVGFAAANNQALSIVNSPYILFLNNDTIFIENSIKRVLKFIKAMDKRVIVGCELLNPDLSHQNSIVDFNNIFNSFGESFFLYKIFRKSKLLNKYNKNFKSIVKPIHVDFIAGAFLFTTLALFKELNGFDERFFFYGEEYDLCYRAKKINAKVIYNPSTSIIHMKGATVNKNLWFKFENQNIAKIQLILKHSSRLNVFSLLVMHYLGMFIRVIIYFMLGFITFNSSLFLKSFYYFRSLFVYPRNKF